LVTNFSAELTPGVASATNVLESIYHHKSQLQQELNNSRQLEKEWLHRAESSNTKVAAYDALCKRRFDCMQEYLCRRGGVITEQEASDLASQTKYQELMRYDLFHEIHAVKCRAELAVLEPLAVRLRSFQDFINKCHTALQQSEGEIQQLTQHVYKKKQQLTEHEQTKHLLRRNVEVELKQMQMQTQQQQQQQQPLGNSSHLGKNTHNSNCNSGNSNSSVGSIHSAVSHASAPGLERSSLLLKDASANHYPGSTPSSSITTATSSSFLLSSSSSLQSTSISTPQSQPQSQLQSHQRPSSLHPGAVSSAAPVPLVDQQRTHSRAGPSKQRQQQRIRITHADGNTGGQSRSAKHIQDGDGQRNAAGVQRNNSFDDDDDVDDVDDDNDDDDDDEDDSDFDNDEREDKDEDDAKDKVKDRDDKKQLPQVDMRLSYVLLQSDSKQQQPDQNMVKSSNVVASASPTLSSGIQMSGTAKAFANESNSSNNRNNSSNGSNSNNQAGGKDMGKKTLMLMKSSPVLTRKPSLSGLVKRGYLWTPQRHSSSSSSSSSSSLSSLSLSSSFLPSSSSSSSHPLQSSSSSSSSSSSLSSSLSSNSTFSLFNTGQQKYELVWCVLENGIFSVHSPKGNAVFIIVYMLFDLPAELCIIFFLSFVNF
jgi:hypothetical protein